MKDSSGHCFKAEIGCCFQGWFSVVDFLWHNTESLILFLKWRGGMGVLGEGRKQEMCFLPEPTVDIGAPFNKEFCTLLFVGENGTGGETCRYRS